MKEPELHPHQRKAVDRLANGKILCGGVGAGKTHTAMQYYVEQESPKDVYVITTARKRDSLDWESTAIEFGVGVSRNATLRGVLQVESWNNIHRLVDVKDAFFIFDEQRLVGSGAWVKSFYKIARNNHWILLSATPGDTWLDYIPVFVANGLYKNKTEFLREHVVFNHYSKFPKVDRYIAVGRLVRHLNNLLVDMPMTRHTVRHIKEVTVEHDVALLKQVTEKRWHVYEDRPLNDVSELFAVMRKVVNSNPSRVSAVQKLMTVHPRLIVFYNFDYELEALRGLLEAPSSRRTTKLSSKGTVEENQPDYKTTTTKSFAKSTSDCSTEKDQYRQTLLEKQKHWSGSLTAHPMNPAASSLTSEKPTKNSGSTSTPTKASSQTRLSKIQKAGSAETTTTTQPTHISSSNLNPLENNGKNDDYYLKTSTTQDRGLTVVPHSSETQSVWDQSVSIAEWNGHKHEPLPTTERWVYLVQYTAGAEAWNCTTTDAVCFFSLNYSYRIFEQCQGRIDRLNTPFTNLYYYVLRSKSQIDANIWKALKAKQNFNEKAFSG